MYAKNGELLDRREMLKVKVKSLAEEARIIRREERRVLGLLRDELSWHRRQDVRSAARTLVHGLRPDTWPKRRANGTTRNKKNGSVLEGSQGNDSEVRSNRQGDQRRAHSALRLVRQGSEKAARWRGGMPLRCLSLSAQNVQQQSLCKSLGDGVLC